MRLVIGEDQALFRAGLTQILQFAGFEIVATAASAPELERALEDPTIEAAVLDVRLPPGFEDEGLVAAIEVRRRRPGFPVLMLSAFAAPALARDLLASGEGSVGYLLKDRVTDIDDFVGSVRRVAAGGTVLDPQVVSDMLSVTRKERPLARLSPRELDVMKLIAEGRSNAAIAARLFVTEKAVGKHVANIFAKLDLPQASDDNRRVLAVLTFLDAG